MTSRRAFLLVIVVAGLALLAFGAFVRRVSLISFNYAGTSEVRKLLDRSMDDQKRLSRLDPERRDEYRRHFDEIRAVTRMLDIVAMNRAAIRRRYERALLAVFAAAVLFAVVSYVVSAKRRERRLARLQDSLEALSRGDTDLVIGDRSRDVVGRIARMIEVTSRDIARDRRRLQYLDHLAAWQEAARRHAHEIRTPLTAARLEVDRLVSDVSSRDAALAPIAKRAQTSIHEELDRLSDFTREFTSFARIAQPRLVSCDLWQVVEEFRATFAGAWKGVQLLLEEASCDCSVRLDKEMFRRVLVNLCNNSALAGALTVTFRVSERAATLELDVADDGRGIDRAIRSRLFEPYTTTRPIGEGMGLGLAISRKIMLDHNGDLAALDAPAGALFRITLPKANS